jgi:hypothetical protein
MATIGFQLAYGNPHVVHLPEHTSHSSFTAGDLIRIVDGCVQIIGDDSTIFGVALKDYNGTDLTPTPVHVISTEDVFIAQMDTASTTKHVGTDLGVSTTAGSQSIHTGSTGAVVVIDFFEPVGTAVGKVLCKFVPATLQTGVGSST